MLVGPPGSGKTQRMSTILRHKDAMIEGGAHVKMVCFVYECWQPEYDRLQAEGIVTHWHRGPLSNEAFVRLVSPHRNNGGSIVV